MKLDHSLSIDLDKFGFVVREQKKNKFVKNRCGRDFLYYAFHYFFPKEFSPITCGPVEIEKRKIFGISLPGWLVWTCLPFYKVPRLLQGKGLTLKINQSRIDSFFHFFKAMALPKHLNVDEALKMVENAVNNGKVSGIDISIGLGGLIDHVLFVYGYDSENLYVFDTHNVQKIKYEKMTLPDDNRFIMRLPRRVVQNMWSKIGRVWIVEKSQ